MALAKTYKVGIRVDADTLKAGRELDAFLSKAQGGLKKLDQGLSRLAKGTAIITAAISAPFIALGRTALKAAMDVQESENLYNRSLKGMAEDTRKWSNDQARALGLNASNLRKNVALTFRMFENMGLASDQALEMAKNINVLAADMASYFNLQGGADEAFDKMKSGLVGMSRPLRDLGIIIDETSVKEELHRAGIKKTASELTEVERVYGRYLVIMRRTADVQGDLIRTSGSLTNQWRRFLARRAEVFEELGSGLLGGATGIVTRGNEFLNRLMDGLQNPQAVSAIQANFDRLLKPMNKFLDFLDELVAKMESDPDSFGKALDRITDLILKLGNAVLWLTGISVGVKLLSFLIDGHLKAAAFSNGLITLASAMNGSAVAAGSLSIALKGLAATYAPLLVLATAITAVVVAVKELSKLQWSPGVEADPFMAGKIAGIAPKDASDAKKQLDSVKAEIERLRKEDPKKLQALEAEFWKEQKKGSMVNAGQYMEWFSKRFAAEAAGTAPPPGTENADALGSSAAERKATFKDFMDAFVKGAGEGLGREFRITSTTGGKHNVGSLHPKGLAFDIVPKSGQMFTDSEVAILREVAKGLKLDLLDERTRPAGQKVWGGSHLHLQASKVLQEELRTGTASAPGSAAMLETFLKSLEEYYNKLDEAERALEEQRYQNRLAAVDGLERLTKEEEHWSMKWGEAWDAMLAATDPLEYAEKALEFERINGELIRIEEERIEAEKRHWEEQKQLFEEQVALRKEFDSHILAGMREQKRREREEWNAAMQERIQLAADWIEAFNVAFGQKINAILFGSPSRTQSRYDTALADFQQQAEFMKQGKISEGDLKPFIEELETAAFNLQIFNQGLMGIAPGLVNFFDKAIGEAFGVKGGLIEHLKTRMDANLTKAFGTEGVGGAFGSLLSGIGGGFIDKWLNKATSWFSKLFGGGKSEQPPKVRGIPQVWIANIDQINRGYTLPTSAIYSGRMQQLSATVRNVNVNVQAGRDIGEEAGRALSRAIERELSRVPV